MIYSIPCATVARLSNINRVLYFDASPWCSAIRIEGPLAIATNRRILACEHTGLDNPPQVFHLALDSVLLAQCMAEAPFDSVLTVTTNDALKWATGTTTLGWRAGGNIGMWCDAPNEMDGWQKIIPEPSKVSRGGFCFNADQIALLGLSSFSGYIIFEQFIDAQKTALVRDINDPDWCGMFLPQQNLEFPPAVKPEWLR